MPTYELPSSDVLRSRISANEIMPYKDRYGSIYTVSIYPERAAACRGMDANKRGVNMVLLVAAADRTVVLLCASSAIITL
jgi:hypothetical protein